MIRRPAVTLMEVLIAMFVMAIGMLALLALFPLGAVSMGQALKDDRCASAANMAEQLAIAMNVRHDLLVEPYYTTQFTQTLPNLYNGPSFPVFVDPYGFNSGIGLNKTQVGTTSNPIARTALNFIITPPYPFLPPPPVTAPPPYITDRFFSLPNDIAFLPGGIPDTSAGSIDRGRDYTWAYFLRRPQAQSNETVDLTVIVYRKRPTVVVDPEQTYVATGAAGSGGLILTWNPTLQSPNLKRGIWLLDTSTIVGTGLTATGLLAGMPSVPQGDFYRVVNISDSSGVGTATLDVQPPLANDVHQVVILDHVAEVFRKGTSWQP